MEDENKSNLCTQNLHLQILILCKKLLVLIFVLMLSSLRFAGMHFEDLWL